MTEAVSIYVTYAVFAAVWYVLQAIGHKGAFKKAGVPASKAFIPVLREMEMFKISWANKNAGKIWACAAVGGLVLLFAGSAIGLSIVGWIGFAAIIYALYLMIRRDLKQAAAFGCSGGFGAGLIFLNPIFNVALAKNTAEYKGAVK